MRVYDMTKEQWIQAIDEEREKLGAQDKVNRKSYMTIRLEVLEAGRSTFAATGVIPPVSEVISDVIDGWSPWIED